MSMQNILHHIMINYILHTHTHTYIYYLRIYMCDIFVYISYIYMYLSYSNIDLLIIDLLSFIQHAKYTHIYTIYTINITLYMYEEYSQRMFMYTTETQCRPQKHFGEDKDETCQVNSMFIAKYLYERNTFALYV